LDTAELGEPVGLFDGRDEPTNELGGEFEIETGATKEMSNDNQGRTCRRRTTRNCRFARGD
jgi:hypothetical protein